MPWSDGNHGPPQPPQKARPVAQSATRPDTPGNDSKYLHGPDKLANAREAATWAATVWLGDKAKGPGQVIAVAEKIYTSAAAQLIASGQVEVSNRLNTADLAESRALGHAGAVQAERQSPNPRSKS